jgi:hypothetical protein
MKKRLLSSATAALAVTAASLWFAGCSPTAPLGKLSDGTAGDISMEFTQMSSESSAGLAKAAAIQGEMADTVVYTSEIILQHWTYDPASKWWTRSFEDSLSDGRAFTRTDSLQFTDAASQLLTTMPAWVTTSGWTHIRHVTRHGMVNTFNSRFEMTVVVAKGADTTATWNGTVSGTWNGAVFSNTVVTNVTRKYADVGGVHWWRFPTSGTISINNPLRVWTITFTGNATVDVTVTRKSDNKQKTFTIDISTGKENE